ncbi:hypothetical protein ACN20G_18525 [Streptomyces sp. BI20]|uniref:hypothetical protein n=1 Tax=Streptomyces sp. BI20 TaxID=3403460 RepID=UPI003C771AFA
MTAAPFGPLDFQLVLLRRMADFHPERVDEARRALGADAARSRAANKHWQAMVRSPRSRGALSRLRSVLGPPESVTTRRVGDLDCEVSTWPVPLWPTLRWEVTAGPGGVIWNAWLVRAPGEPGPPPGPPAALAPWSATLDEVARAHPGARVLPGDAPTRDRLALVHGGRSWLAEFTHGLLQRVTDLGPAPAP